jgi:hypothetical protein
MRVRFLFFLNTVGIMARVYSSPQLDELNKLPALTNSNVLDNHHPNLTAASVINRKRGIPHQISDAPDSVIKRRPNRQNAREVSCVTD